MEPRPDQDLVDYIKRRKETGGNLIEITNELVAAGWDTADIHKAIASLGSVVVKQGVSNTTTPVQLPGFGQQQLQLESSDGKITVPTRFGSLIILLVATIAGSGVWLYSSNEPEAIADEVLPSMSKPAVAPVVTIGPLDDSDYEIKTDGVYYKEEHIKSADPATFQYVGGDYAKDKVRVYQGQYIINVDRATFEYVGGSYTKDDANVYFLGESIKDADVKTFEYVDDDYAKDATNVYKKGMPIENANPAQCVAENTDECEG